MHVSDFIGKKVIVHTPNVPKLCWYSLTETEEYEPSLSPYNNKVGSVTIQYTDETITEDDEMVVVHFNKAHILPNGTKVSWLPISIHNLEIIEERTMKRYQAYAWDGNQYQPMSVPIYKTEQEAIDAAKEIILDRDNKSVLNSVRLHWKNKPIIAKPKEL